ALPVPGRHLGLNSAAALLIALRLGVPAQTAIAALAAFPGVRRRFELKGTADGVRVYDEYAYHPTSMTAALRTLREVAGDGRLIGGRQPRRVARARARRAGIAAAVGIAAEAGSLEVSGPRQTRAPGEGRVALTAAVELPAEAEVF